MTTGLTTEQSLALVRRIADAPATLEELERRTPGVRKVVELLAAHGAKPDEAFMRVIGRALMLASSLDAKLLGKAVLPDDENAKLLAAIKGDPEIAGVLFDSLVPHLQRRILEDRYRMEPARMLALMERYGPLDWRHAESHGIYWSERGIEIGRTLGRRKDTNELLIIRSRLHMLGELMKTGRVDYDPVTDRVDLLPDPRFVASYERSMAEAIDLITSAEGVSAGGFGLADEDDLANGYETFLNLAVILEYLYGDRADAERHFLELRSLAEKAGRADDPLYVDTLESFVAIEPAAVHRRHDPQGDLRGALQGQPGGLQPLHPDRPRRLRPPLFGDCPREEVRARGSAAPAVPEARGELVRRRAAAGEPAGARAGPRLGVGPGDAPRLDL
jgi:hypothetical protein